MKNEHKLISFALLFFIFTAFFSGCYDKSELNEISLVIGMGVDKKSDDNSYHLTLELANPNATKGDGGVQGKSNNSIIEESSGKTLYDAFQNFSKTEAIIMDFSHIKIIVISKKTCESGVTEILDYIARNPHFRNTNWLFVAEKTAKEVLESKISNQDITSLGLAYMMSKLKKETYILPVNTNNFIIGLDSQSKSSFLPVVDVEKSENDPQGKIKVEKTAVFKNDRMIGTLSTEESRNLLWLINRAKGTLVVSPFKSGDSDKELTLKVYKKSSKFVPHITKEGISFDIKCAATAEIKDVKNVNLDAEEIEKIQQNTEVILEGQVRELIDKLQKDLNADIIGFSEKIYNNDPDEWFRIKDHWNEMFPSIKYQVSFEVSLTKIGMNKNSPTMDKEEENLK